MLGPSGSSQHKLNGIKGAGGSVDQSQSPGGQSRLPHTNRPKAPETLSSPAGPEIPPPLNDGPSSLW